MPQQQQQKKKRMAKKGYCQRAAYAAYTTRGVSND